MRDTYSEVYEILNILGEEYINRLPKKLYNLIENERNRKSIIEFDINQPPFKQNISDKASAIIAYLNLQYWCTEEERKKLIEQYIRNDEQYNQELKRKYNSDDLFKHKKVNTKTELIEFKEKESIFKKLLYKIKNMVLKINNKNK